MHRRCGGSRTPRAAGIAVALGAWLALGLAACGERRSVEEIAASAPASPLSGSESAADSGPSLHVPAGWTARVVQLRWGGPPRARRLGVRFADGRFAVYEPEQSSVPVSLAPSDRDAPAQALAVLGSGQVLTGDARGLTLWDTRGGTARAIAHQPCGTVTALADDRLGAGDVLAGLADGRLLRFRVRGDDPLPPPLAEAWVASGEAGAGERGITSLDVLDDARAVLIVRADGQAFLMRDDLTGEPTPLGPGRMVAAIPDPPRLVRLVEGPALAITRSATSDLIGRLALPEPATSLALVPETSQVAVGSDHGVLIVNLGGEALVPERDVRLIRAAPGPAAVAADPIASRLALADASGRLDVLDRDALALRAARWPLDESADLAYQPHRRLYRPREGTDDEGLDLPSGLLRQIEEARDRLDQGEGAHLLGLLRELDTHPALTSRAAAEVVILSAAAEQAAGWSPAVVFDTLEQARRLFERRGPSDRLADVLFWQAVLRAPPIDDPVTPAPPEIAALHDARSRLERAERRYHDADPPQSRAALLCRGLRAWVLLALGEVRDAFQAFQAVADARAEDPVLAQVVELDRIASALAAAGGDWAAVEAAEARLQHRLEPGRHLAASHRRAALARLTALAAMGRWDEASRLAPARPEAAEDDAEWSLRLGTAQARAGRPVTWLNRDGGPSSHLRGRLLADAAVGSGDTRRLDEARAELARAAQDHRQHGRDALAIEADLERAEVLERRGRPAEAARLYASVIRRLRALRARTTDPAALAVEPIRAVGARPYRGLARCQLALDQPAHALMALEQAELALWFDQVGETRARTAMIGRPPEAQDPVLALHEARQALDDPDSTADPTAVRERIQRLEAALMAEQRVLALGDPLQAFDTSALRLGEHEAVLIYAAVGPESLVGLLARGRRPPEVRVLPASRSALTQVVAAWRAALGDGGRRSEPEAPGLPRLDGLVSLAPEPDGPPPSSPPPGRDPARESAAWLDEVLLRPFDAALAGVSDLIVVPGDGLGALSFEMIGTDQRRLMSRLRVRYAPMASFVRLGRDDRRARARAGAAWRVLLMAPDEVGPSGRSPTPGADPRALLRALATTIQAEGHSPRVVVGPEATPPRLLTEPVWEFHLLHLAAGWDRGPVGTDRALRLAAGDGGRWGDGRLTASDIVRLPLRARLVSLAVGSPDPRDASPGDAPRDLARAWLAAGAETVIVSLWPPAAESGRRFFDELHRELAEGQPPGAALDRARRAVARDPRFRDPVHWAGFVLYSVF